MKCLYKAAKFNPNAWKAANPEAEAKLSTWTSGASPQARNSLPPMEGAAREKALHKLSGKTKVRVGEDGGRQYLLHRGMSKDESRNCVNGCSTFGKGTINHDQHSSWTPNKKIASHFGKEHGGGTVSAWIPESHIHNIPSIYGATSFPGDSESFVGPQSHRDEHEVVVKPGHNSKLATIDESSTPHDVNYTINQPRLGETAKEKTTDLKSLLHTSRKYRT